MVDYFIGLEDPKGLNYIEYEMNETSEEQYQLELRVLESLSILKS